MLLSLWLLFDSPWLLFDSLWLLQAPHGLPFLICFGSLLLFFSFPFTKLYETGRAEISVRGALLTIGL